MTTGLILAYFVAGGGLVVRILLSSSWSERLVAISLVLFATDLARMALVDLANLRSVRLKLPSIAVAPSQLTGFASSLLATIALELLGLLIGWGWAGIGIAIVMLSQLVFNVSVTIELQPDSEPPARHWPISERVDVLLADGVAFVLAIAWSVAGQSIGIAIVLLAMTTIYLGLKYCPRLEVKGP